MDFRGKEGLSVNGNRVWHAGNFDPDSKLDRANFDAHVANTSNPHGVTKSQVGLGSVSNYGIATQAEARAGTSNSKYMTPLRTKEAINALRPNIAVSASEPSGLNAGDWWYKEV